MESVLASGDGAANISDDAKWRQCEVSSMQASRLISREVSCVCWLETSCQSVTEWSMLDRVSLKITGEPSVLLYAENEWVCLEGPGRPHSQAGTDMLQPFCDYHIWLSLILRGCIELYRDIRHYMLPSNVKLVAAARFPASKVNMYTRREASLLLCQASPESTAEQSATNAVGLVYDGHKFLWHKSNWESVRTGSRKGRGAAAW